MTFACYWLLPSRKAQNALLLVAGYVFYGWWDWRFGCLLLVSSCVDFFVGSRLAVSWRSKAARKRLLALSFCVNLGMLGFFKYANFFADSAASLASALGMHVHPLVLNVVLPVGLSFYTFQTLSYAVDIYRRQLKPADELSRLPRVRFVLSSARRRSDRARRLDAAAVPARRESIDSEDIQAGHAPDAVGLHEEVGARRQLGAHRRRALRARGWRAGPGARGWRRSASRCRSTCDFSGYSDIAIGTARLFGFRLTRNFAHPYFSRSVAEFWRRWHISLSTWFRDYVYIPLGGSRTSRARQALQPADHVHDQRAMARRVVQLRDLGRAQRAVDAAAQSFAAAQRVKARQRTPLGEALLPSPRELWQMARTFAVDLRDVGVLSRRDLARRDDRVPARRPRSAVARRLRGGARESAERRRGCSSCSRSSCSVEWLQRRQAYGLALVWPRPLRWVGVLRVHLAVRASACPTTRPRSSTFSSEASRWPTDRNATHLSLRVMALRAAVFFARAGIAAGVADARLRHRRIG